MIQKVKKKKPNQYGARKEIKVTETTFGFAGEKPKTTYGYTYSDERYERPVLDAYKISIHKSYRENGKVKKKQWVICTMGYYDFIDSWYGDYYLSDKMNRWLKEMEINEDQFYEIINVKVDPLTKMIEKEFNQTEEYKAEILQKVTLDKYRRKEKEFDKEYGQGEYKHCYDVFGNLRNPDYLEGLKTKKKAQEDYTKRSYEESFKRTYSNYSSGGSSSYSFTSQGNYTDEEKKILHEIYRMASKKFHPDISGDNGSKMKFLTKLKEQWGL
ncbi:hypothetical protein [Lysinibacillus agricola]|uniref:hypothetical protein n=1 Tax=Lysinibacillus agricola TaxID=2590012 RepID=UPI003C26B8FF